MKLTPPRFMMKLKSENGSLLIIALFLLTVLLLLSTAFVINSMTEMRTSERQKMTMQSFHLAEAGMERALYDLKEDFSGVTSWSDGAINTYSLTGPDGDDFYTIDYNDTTITNLGAGSFAVQIKYIGGTNDAIWIKTTGAVGDATQNIMAYAKIKNVSPWNNAIFAGSGASGGTTINGNVDIRGSVHILGVNLTSADYAVDLGGTTELIGNNYNGLDAGLLAKVPALPTVDFNGETIETLNAELRVKQGKVGLSGSATAGQPDISGNAYKETVDNVYCTDEFGGTGGSSNVHSDNGWSNGYDLGDSVEFPDLTAAYISELETNGYVVSDAAELTDLENIGPNSSFTIGDTNNYIEMDGTGNMTIKGIVFIDENMVAGKNGDFVMNIDGEDNIITYSGSGLIYASGNVEVNVNLVTPGSNSFPANIIGVMTSNNISMNSASIDVMGLFYAKGTITIAKQTDLIGTIVANEFDMGLNVPSVYQVPETANFLPSGMVGQEGVRVMKIVSWQIL
ncbi:MAG: hypothetical protein KAJ18_06180 [Candidatus Omnitrophica bacterium]|nr:hypothetical protein [Candidatus Omnitrophota bacterium]